MRKYYSERSNGMVDKMSTLNDATNLVTELVVTATDDEELNVALLLRESLRELTRCKNCKYIRPLKHNFETGKGFENSYACVVWEYYAEKDETIDIQEVGLDSRCELFALDEKKFKQKWEKKK